MNEESPKRIRRIVRLRRQDIPNDELLADLRRVAHSLGKDTVSRWDYGNTGRYGRTTLENRFGSWTAALAAAGLKRGLERIDNDESLFENLLDVWTKLGRQPRYAEMRRPLSRWSTKPYEKRFGTWNRALIAFARFVDAEIEGEQPAVASTDKRRNSARRTRRDPDLRLKWRVLQRDKFKCRACGRGWPDVELDIDHVLPWSKGGETEVENLQTLCSKCNLGKGDLQ